MLLSKPWADDGRVLLRRQILSGLDGLSPFGGVVAIIWREKGRTVLNESERI
jgi:hypothetical protein